MLAWPLFAFSRPVMTGEMSLTATQPDLVWTAGGDIRVEGHASNVKTGEVVTCLLIRSQGRKARPCGRDNGRFCSTVPARERTDTVQLLSAR
jgi:hypothetical protein